jgi:small subunit ribosomal protein S16
MAVVIRLMRMGRKNRLSYRLIVADSRMRRDGRSLEIIGNYDPLGNPSKISVKEERALYWLLKGAKPSETAKSILKKSEVWRKFKDKK